MSVHPFPEDRGTWPAVPRQGLTAVGRAIAMEQEAIDRALAAERVRQIPILRAARRQGRAEGLREAKGYATAAMAWVLGVVTGACACAVVLAIGGL